MSLMSGPVRLEVYPVIEAYQPTTVTQQESLGQCGQNENLNLFVGKKGSVSLPTLGGGE